MIEQMIPVATRDIKRKPKVDVRVSVRYATYQEVGCRPIAVLKADSTQTSLLGRVRDVSCKGLALRLSRRVEPGAMLVAELLTDGSGVPHCRPVRVVHATREGNGLWIIGCEFFAPLSEEELQALVGE